VLGFVGGLALAPYKRMDPIAGDLRKSDGD
jgi:hypothetical protein